MPAHLKSVDRPITLVFARTKDVDGLKEALVARRTLAWLDNQVWGDAALLTALWGASVNRGACTRHSWEATSKWRSGTRRPSTWTCGPSSRRG